MLMTTDHSVSNDSELVLVFRGYSWCSLGQVRQLFHFDKIVVTYCALGSEIHDETASQNGMEQGTDECAVYPVSAEAI
jgi:hypothetical protein